MRKEGARMLDYKFKKLVKSYPNLVDGRFAISNAKAEEIIAKEGGNTSLEEIVERAKKRANLPDSEWEPFDSLIKKEQSAANRRRSSVGWALGGMRRRIVILMSLVVFITLFFIVTPTGRIWARQLYNFILSVKENSFIIKTNGVDILPSAKYKERHYSSYEEFEAETGYTTYKFANTLDLPLELMMSVNSNDEFGLYSVFLTEADNRLCVYQFWNVQSPSYGIGDPASTFWDYALPDGTILHCQIDSADSSFNAVTQIGNSYIMILADSGVDYRYYIFGESKS